LTARSILADANLWLATIVTQHPHHQSAQKWWKKEVLPSGSQVAFCRLTQLGLLRLLTNNRVMGNQRRDCAQAWTDYLQLLKQRPVVYKKEPKNLDGILAGHCKLGGSSPNFWTDAYLAAFAKAGGLTFVTFDKGFKRFPKLKLELLP
jgi:toxin-antitoxin system PIN domain toxin